EAKAKAAKRESEVRKEELVGLLGPEVVNKYYNDKLQFDKYCDKMLNRRAESRITNCDVLTKKGPITLKVYREDELGINLDIPLREQDPLGKLNDLADKKQDFATIEDQKDFSNTMLYTIQEVFFRRHQGLGPDDYAKTFSSFLLVEVD
nr:hypothetical protein [Tanacetum cinerariifolium]